MNCDSNIYFPQNTYYKSNDLPTTLISLEEWGLITIYGKDAIKYLNTQFTSNILTLQKNQFYFSGHCNVYGKLYTTMYIFYYHNGIACIEHRNLLKTHYIELKKYSIFSNVNITINNENILLGVAGLHAYDIIYDIFNIKPNISNPVIIYNNNTTIIYINNVLTSRFIIITNILTYKKIIQKINNKILKNNSTQWKILEIEAGYPVIDYINTQKFIPQKVNLHMIKNALSFNKGCYLGQEIITKIQYKNINKEILCHLVGTASIPPKIGEPLEIKINDNMHFYWKNTGAVLSFCFIKKNTILIQAIIYKNLLQPNVIFRVTNDEYSILDTIISIYNY